MYSEGFETTTTGALPTGWVENTGGSFRASTSQAHGGSKSALFGNTGTNYGFIVGPSGGNLCAGASLTFWLKFTTMPVGSDLLRIVLQNANNNNPNSGNILIDHNGKVQLLLGVGLTGYYTDIGTMSVNTWTDFKLTAACGGSSTTFTLVSTVAGFSGTATQSLTYANIQRIVMAFYGPNVMGGQAPSSSNTVYWDDFGVAVGGASSDDSNPLGHMVNFLNDSWGFDWSWIIGAIILAICLVGVLKATHGSALAGSVVIILVEVANIKLGLWPEWSLLVMVFLIIAIATNGIFNRKDGDDSA